MSKTEDFSQHKIEKLLEKNQQLDIAFNQLLSIIRQQQDIQEMTKFYSIGCINSENLDSLLILMDDIFVGYLKSKWQLHYPISRINHQFAHKISLYSEAKARKFISQALISGECDFAELNQQALNWLFPHQAVTGHIRIIRLSDNFNDGFIALSQQDDSIVLGNQFYDFVSRVTHAKLLKLLAD